MAKNSANFSTNSHSVLQLLHENEASALFGAAFASSFLINPTVVWSKFILTDDMVNGNGMRIPRQEFSNLISTGVHMPLKMAIGNISPGHENTHPLGTIVHLKEIPTESGGSAILALAALWAEERPADVKYIRDRVQEGKDVDVSWEILYEDSVFNEEHGSVDLLSTVLRAATIVGNPAYGGRTHFLSVAAKKWSKSYIESLPNEHFLYVAKDGTRHFPIMDSDGKLDRAKMTEAMQGLGTLDLPVPIIKEKKAVLQTLLSRFEAGASLDDVSKEFYTSPAKPTEDTKLETLEEIKAQLATSEDKAQAAESKIAELQTALDSTTNELAALKEQFASMTTELDELRTFKSQLDAEVELQTKIQSLKDKFAEAGIQKDDAFFSENAERLVKLDEDVLNLMIEQLKEANTKVSEAQASSNTNIPPLQSEDTLDLSDVKTLGKILREKRFKK